MQAEYQLSFKDYCDAHWLHLKRRPLSMLFYIVFFWFIPILGLLLIAFYLLELTQGNSENAAQLLANIGPFVAMSIILIALRRFGLWRTYTAIFPKGNHQVVFSFDEEQFISAIPSRSEARVYWSALEKFEEDDKQMLLFPARNRFFIVPKRALPEEGWLAMRNFARGGKRVAAS